MGLISVTKRSGEILWLCRDSNPWHLSEKCDGYLCAMSSSPILRKAAGVFENQARIIIIRFPWLLHNYFWGLANVFYFSDFKPTRTRWSGTWRTSSGTSTRTWWPSSRGRESWRLGTICRSSVLFNCQSTLTWDVVAVVNRCWTHQIS